MIILKEHKQPPSCLRQALALCAIVILGNVYSVTACADENQLKIKPTRCIALHEGQVCYQTLTISWTADLADTYCLYQQTNKAPLMCWENVASGKVRYEFEGNASQKFVLSRKQDNKPIAEFTLEVAWVYDASSRRESHWRVF